MGITTTTTTAKNSLNYDYDRDMLNEVKVTSLIVELG